MSKSLFLSDDINFNKQYNKIRKEKDFVSGNNLNNYYDKNKKNYIVKNYQTKTNEKCVIRSATSKKWSIKFK